MWPTQAAALGCRWATIHEPDHAMRSSRSDQAKLFRLAAMCQEAIQSQHQRASSQGYGLDDYTEGRIVGAANLARKLMRVIAGDQPEAAREGVHLRKHLGR